MLSGIFKFFRQPPAARLLAGAVLAAVLILTFILIVRHFSWVPPETRFLPSDCANYVRIADSGNGKIRPLAQKIAGDLGIADIYSQAGTGTFSFCQRADGSKIVFIQSRDKTIESAISSAGFGYAKIGKGRYLLSSEPAQGEGRLSSKLAGHFNGGDSMMIYISSQESSQLGFEPLSRMCGGKDCYLRGHQAGSYLKVFANDPGKKPDLSGLGEYDFAMESTGRNALCSNAASAMDIQVPQWAQLIGKEGFESFACDRFFLAFEKINPPPVSPSAEERNQSDDTNGPLDISKPSEIAFQSLPGLQAQASNGHSVWQDYKIGLVFQDDSDLGAKITDLERYLKKSIASLFPFAEKVELNDGTEVSEIKIDPDKLVFKEKDGYRFLEFPDKSAVIYYRIEGNKVIIANFEPFIPPGGGISGDFVYAKASLLKNFPFYDYFSIYSSVYAQGNAFYLE